MHGLPQSSVQIARRTEISSRHVHGIISRQARFYFVVLAYETISITVPKCAENDDIGNVDSTFVILSGALVTRE